MEKDIILELIKNELTRTTGCTDPGVICYAVAVAKENLGEVPDKIDLKLSLNIFKNAVNVGIPGTGESGIELAAALGAVSENSNAKLSILESVTPKMIEEAKSLVNKRIISVKSLFPENIKEGLTPKELLYIEVNVFKGSDSVKVVIHSDYTNVALIEKNKKIIFENEENISSKSRMNIKSEKFSDLVNTILSMESKDFEFLLDAAKVNFEAAEKGLSDRNTIFGKSIFGISHCAIANELRPVACCTAKSVETYTAAAGEARMIGLKVPVIALTGSGNQGITALVGVYSASLKINPSKDVLLQALAISAISTILFKSYLGRLTTICGCAVAASVGVSAGVVHLLGGKIEDMVNAMHSVIGTFAGMICDGAKVSCAYKLSAAASSAVEYAYFAMNGAFVPKGDGIVGYTIEQTLENLATLNNIGMVETDRIIVKIMEKTLKEKL
ncbi:MAG: serine dehydratase subunit alpha family protein [Spirochaetales bacterium]|jgi:L-cysteine desulfidase|nr:L-serine ammonia-lyase, iron-sulfur-dependent, subunit alpha [Exilispira sp.]NMC66642.1 serine dehydratase subunit alpha family protein [Spirochaetales bacterium]